jgi:DNA-binding PadR family transcriptional regulator
MHLKYVVLKILSKNKKSGYGLIKEINKQMNWKPSSGSMYPLLNDLLKDGLVKVEKEGRKKLYSITSEGEKKLKEFDQVKDKYIEQTRAHLKVFESICNLKLGAMTSMLDNLKKDKPAFGKITPEIFMFREVFFDLYNKNKIKGNEAKIKKIFNKAIKDLKNIK